MPYLCESRFERWISYFVMFFCLSLSELTFKYGAQAYLNPFFRSRIFNISKNAPKIKLQILIVATTIECLVRTSYVFPSTAREDLTSVFHANPYNSQRPFGNLTKIICLPNWMFDKCKIDNLDIWKPHCVHQINFK